MALRRAIDAERRRVGARCKINRPRPLSCRSRIIVEPGDRVDLPPPPTLLQLAPDRSLAEQAAVSVSLRPSGRLSPSDSNAPTPRHRRHQFQVLRAIVRPSTNVSTLTQVEQLREILFFLTALMHRDGALTAV